MNVASKHSSEDFCEKKMVAHYILKKNNLISTTILKSTKIQMILLDFKRLGLELPNPHFQASIKLKNVCASFRVMKYFPQIKILPAF